MLMLQARNGDGQRATHAVQTCRVPATCAAVAGIEEDGDIEWANRRKVSARANKTGGRRWCCTGMQGQGDVDGSLLPSVLAKRRKRIRALVTTQSSPCQPS